MGPITVVSSGSSIQNPSNKQVLFSSKNPFTKLDTRTTTSFQTISLLFDHEPPQPGNSIGAYTQTLVYQFPHGYTYIPSVWLMWQNDSPEFPATPSSGNSATTYYPFGDDTSSQAQMDIFAGSGAANDGTVLAEVAYNSSGTIDDTTFAWLTMNADAKNVYIYLFKYCAVTIGGNAVPLFMAGVTLDIRAYVFAEPASTSTY